MAKLTKYEQETILRYDQAEPDACCFVSDPSLIRKLDEMSAEREEVTCVRRGDGWGDYRIPKSWIKIRPPKQLSDEQRAKLADRMREVRQG